MAFNSSEAQKNFTENPKNGRGREVNQNRLAIESEKRGSDTRNQIVEPSTCCQNQVVGKSCDLCMNRFCVR